MFCSAFTPPVNAGGGKNAYNFARFLSDKRYPVTLLSLNRMGKLPSHSISGDLVIRRILYFNQNMITKLFSLFIILPTYFYYIVRNDVVFIYGGNIIGYEFLILSGRILGKKVVFRSTMLDEDDITTMINKSSLLRPVRKWILRLMNYYFSINPEFTRSYVEVFGGNHKIIESVQGVDIRFFHPVTQDEKRMLKTKLGLPENLFLIITVGFLVRRKGFKGIFEALEKLNIPFLYIVVGDYDVDKSHYLYHIRKEMKSLYDMGSCLLGDKIFFTGPKENVNEYLQASDVFLLNSKREGVSNALLEAMACGISPVLKSLKGIEQYITKHNQNSLGFDNSQEIYDTILKMFENSDLRNDIGARAFETVSGHWTFDHVMERLTEQDILNG